MNAHTHAHAHIHTYTLTDTHTQSTPATPAALPGKPSAAL